VIPAAPKKILVAPNQVKILKAFLGPKNPQPLVVRTPNRNILSNIKVMGVYESSLFTLKIVLMIFKSTHFWGYIKPNI